MIKIIDANSIKSNVMTAAFCVSVFLFFLHLFFHCCESLIVIIRRAEEKRHG